MIFGFNYKLLRINLTKERFYFDDISEERIEKFMGGRGVAASYYFEEILPSAEPLGSENKLIFFTGILTGTCIPASTKFQLATKSPLTGIYDTTNAGGNFGPWMKTNGIDGIIIEGRSRKPVGILISEEDVEFLDASSLWGKTTIESAKIIQNELGNKKSSWMAIGQAGERKVRFSTIQTDGRSFGRGGAGAVMGSKNLKFILIKKGSKKVQLSDFHEVNNLRPVIVSKIRKSKEDASMYGRTLLVDVMHEIGIMPVRYYQEGVFNEINNITMSYIRENYNVGRTSCFNCPIVCTQVFEVKDGPYKGVRSDIEYESLWSLGPLCGISEFPAILKANSLCDAYGLDTMETGNIIGLIMYAKEKGIIKDKLKILDINFGDAEKMVELIKLIANRKGVAEILGEGLLNVENVLLNEKGSAVHVKGMSLAGYDPRGVVGMSLSFGTAPRGACHLTGGWTVSTEVLSGKYDRFDYKSKWKLVKDIQDRRGYVDSLGICTDVRRVLGFGDPTEEVILKAVTGYDFTPKLMEIGERVFTLERVITTREGITRKDDYLPPRMYNETLKKGQADGHVISKKKYDQMLDDYYSARLWDNKGIPTNKCLKKLNLGDFVLKTS